MKRLQTTLRVLALLPCAVALAAPSRAVTASTPVTVAAKYNVVFGSATLILNP